MKEYWNDLDIGKRIGQALIVLLKQQPIEKISVKDICAEAEINRTTFYNHFDDKYQLLEAVQQACVEVFLTVFQEFVDDLPSHLKTIRPEQYLVSREILTYYLELVKQYRDAFLVFALKQGQIYSADQYDLMVRSIVLPMLQKYGIDDSHMADYMTSFYLGAFHSLILAWIRNDCQEPVEYIVKVIRGSLRIPEEFFT